MDNVLKEIRNFVGTHEPFTRLTPWQLARAAKSFRIDYFRRDAIIIEVGDENEWLSVVRSGAVELQLGGTELEARLGEGDVFGYPSLINNSVTLNRVTAMEDSLLYRIPKAVFLELRAENAAFAQFFIAEESLRLRHAVENLKSRSPDAQMAAIFASVKDMLHPRPIVRASVTDTIGAAAKTMAREDVSTLLINDGEALASVLTDKDLRRRVFGRWA